MRYCATSRNVAVSIPDGVIGIFHYIILTAAFNTTSNRNEYQEYFLGSKDGQCEQRTTLTPSSADCLEIWEPQPPGTPGPLTEL
jgi:hypothetical protein